MWQPPQAAAPGFVCQSSPWGVAADSSWQFSQKVIGCG